MSGRLIMLAAGAACLLPLTFVLLRVAEEADFRRLQSRLMETQARYIRGDWRRPPRGARGRDCNALREVHELLSRPELAVQGSAASPSAERAQGLERLRRTLECKGAYWPDTLGTEVVPYFDWARHSSLVEDLRAKGRASAPRECFASSLEVIRLGYDLASGGGIQLRVSIATREGVLGVSTALGCLERASVEDIDAVIAEYVAQARVQPPFQWTFAYLYTDEAFRELVRFRARPWIPKFWSAAGYDLTSGARILRRMELLLGAAERAAALSPDEPNLVLELHALHRSVPTSLSGIVPFERVIDEIERAMVMVRVFACVLTKFSSNPAAQNQVDCSDVVVFRDASGDVRAYSRGRNGRDERGTGDDTGIHFRANAVQSSSP